MNWNINNKQQWRFRKPIKCLHIKGKYFQSMTNDNGVFVGFLSGYKKQEIKDKAKLFGVWPFGHMVK